MDIRENEHVSEDYESLQDKVSNALGDSYNPKADTKSVNEWFNDRLGIDPSSNQEMTLDEMVADALGLSEDDADDLEPTEKTVPDLVDSLTEDSDEAPVSDPESDFSVADELAQETGISEDTAGAIADTLLGRDEGQSSKPRTESTADESLDRGHL